MISKTFSICDAYEAGYGKGQVLSKDVNPYDPISQEWEAWNIGYRKARDRQVNQLLAAGEIHSGGGYEESTHEKQQKFAIRREDPCPGCNPGGVCRTPSCGRLKLPLDHPLRTVSFWKENK